jgi:hypothetical protein
MRTALLGVLAFGVGLAPYAYLVVAARSADARTTWTWGDTRDLHGLVRHFLRAEYGTTELGLGEHVREPVTQLAALARSLVVGELGLPVIGMLGAAIALARTRSLRRRSADLALIASFALAGPIFVSWFNIAPRGVRALIVERFYLLPSAIVAVLSARGVDVLLPTIRDRAWLARAMTALATLTSAVLFAPRVREHHRPDVERYVHDALRLAPKDAVIVGSGDHRFGAFLYARYALGERPDAVFVNPKLLLGSWYPPRVSRLLGIEIVRGEPTPGRPDYPTLSVPKLTAQLLATGRPLFFTDWFVKGFEKNVPSYPVGPLIRVLDDPRQVPQPDSLLAMNSAAAAQLDGPTVPPADPGTWGGDLAGDYARPWRVLAEAFERDGRSERAAACASRARVFMPSESAP